MKKSIIILIIGICFSVGIFADNASSNIYFETEMLIEEGLYKNMLTIQRNSAVLSSMHKMELIREFKQDYTVPLILNIFLPFGVGSFYQGDTTGGVIGLGGDLAAFSLYAFGLVNYYTSLSEYDSDSENVEINDVLADSVILFVSSGIVALATAVFKIVRPISFANKYNDDLFMVLGSDNQYSMKVVPGIDMTSSGNLTSSISLSVLY